jgi:hypothetical protein
VGEAAGVARPSRTNMCCVRDLCRRSACAITPFCLLPLLLRCSRATCGGAHDDVDGACAVV